MICMINYDFYYVITFFGLFPISIDYIFIYYTLVGCINDSYYLVILYLNHGYIIIGFQFS